MSTPAGPEASAAASSETSSAESVETSSANNAPALSLLFDRWVASIRITANRWLTVAALEARVAALNLTLMLIVAVASGLLLASAWIALFAAIVAGLHALGLTWHLALLLVALVNFILALLGFHYINRMSNHLIFNTLRALVAEPEQHHADNLTGPAAGDTAPKAPH
ncbi:MAG TPA: hypothetical protein VLC91_02015 [Spongiibacteraceae bacterium]|nr:hypothetical protein [Spongiibacteraceae bacterium]